jgi:hypothetical protein
MKDERQNDFLPSGWLNALDRAEADIAAGRTVSGEVVKRRLETTLAEMEARETAANGKASRRC